MTDVTTWQALPREDNPMESDLGVWQIVDTPARPGQPPLVVDVTACPNGRVVADLIVAAVQATAPAALAPRRTPGAGRGWRDAPDCAACGDTGLHPQAGPGVPCACKRGRRLAELHQAARGCEVDHPDDEPLPPYGGAASSRFNPLEAVTLVPAAGKGQTP
ncbi:hypothetical protein F5972_08465 [Microbispora cellulosiformans]|uniref:Uncharacterized protein n=1 Tax=Microbispora cellulosiformans TaxID=2614688 RepID=A0A5J5K4Z8_9ACTN|nr:hypothetical protein [Microbispora cellulosiformans]KAA9379675.1 hypothetical protein F5972_08465 [Microbispora cellulosiformans]